MEIRTAMNIDAKDRKAGFRKYQSTVSVEEKIMQLYAMQRRYLAISKAAIAGGLKKPSDDFLRASRLMESVTDTKIS